MRAIKKFRFTIKTTSSKRTIESTAPSSLWLSSFLPQDTEASFFISSSISFNKEGLLADLIDLVDQLLKGESVGRPSNVNKTFSTEPIYYTSFGRVEIQYLKSMISSQT